MTRLIVRVAIILLLGCVGSVHLGMTYYAYPKYTASVTACCCPQNECTCAHQCTHHDESGSASYSVGHHRSEQLLAAECQTSKERPSAVTSAQFWTLISGFSHTYGYDVVALRLGLSECAQPQPIIPLTPPPEIS